MNKKFQCVFIFSAANNAYPIAIVEFKLLAIPKIQERKPDTSDKGYASQFGH